MYVCVEMCLKTYILTGPNKEKTNNITKYKYGYYFTFLFVFICLFVQMEEHEEENIFISTLV